MVPFTRITISDIPPFIPKDIIEEKFCHLDNLRCKNLKLRRHMICIEFFWSVLDLALSLWPVTGQYPPCYQRKGTYLVLEVSYFALFRL